MFEDIDNALESGYNNAGALLGIGLGDTDSDILGALDRLNPIKRFKVMKNLFAGTRISRGSRADMEKHFRVLPKHVKSELIKGRLRLADWAIYTIKPLSSKTVKLFESQDVKSIGLRNISDAKLPKNTVITVSGIRMMSGIAVDAKDKDQVLATSFRSISKMPALVNGEFSFTSNRKQIVPEGFTNWYFETDNNHSLPLGYHKLDNPRSINDEELIESVIELGTMEGMDTNAVVKVGFFGTITTP
ncbi:MAG: hypothetical protein JKX76_02950 [Colwellia sp.]|nr:hypothetical protein [Colwellia sp.]